VHVVLVEEFDQIDQEIVLDLLRLDEDLHVMFLMIVQLLHYHYCQQRLGFVPVLVFQYHDESELFQQHQLIML
jgi:hypothetical protein